MSNRRSICFCNTYWWGPLSFDEKNIDGESIHVKPEKHLKGRSYRAAGDGAGRKRDKRERVRVDRVGKRLEWAQTDRIWWINAFSYLRELNIPSHGNLMVTVTLCYAPKLKVSTFKSLKVISIPQHWLAGVVEFEAWSLKSILTYSPSRSLEASTTVDSQIWFERKYTSIAVSPEIVGPWIVPMKKNQNRQSEKLPQNPRK